MEFLQLVAAHPWIFAIFPSRIYVSVRRNLPNFEYPTFVKKVSSPSTATLAPFSSSPRQSSRSILRAASPRIACCVLCPSSR